MNQSSDITDITAHLSNVFYKTEEVLNEWKGEGCLQFSVLFSMLALELKWSDADIKEHDPIIRYFISQHSQYSSRRGARGGIIRSEDKLKLEEERLKKIERKRKEEESRDEILTMLKNKTLKITKEDIGEQ